MLESVLIIIINAGSFHLGGEQFLWLSSAYCHGHRGLYVRFLAFLGGHHWARLR